MATTEDFITYVCEQIRGTGEIRFKKMFGEYMVYVNDKPVLLVCDNTVFVKKLEIIAEQMKDADVGMPYQGAKEHFVLDIDHREFAVEMVGLLETVIPVPKPRKKKGEGKASEKK